VKWIKIIIKIIAGLIIFFFAIHFSIQNRDEVTIRYAFLNLFTPIEIAEIPLFLVIFCSIFLGILIGGTGDFFRRIKLKKELRQNQREVRRLGKEIESLRGSSSPENQPSFLKKED
jgi:lipopolysaccharide assembly protein A